MKGWLRDLKDLWVVLVIIVVWLLVVVPIYGQKAEVEYVTKHWVLVSHVDGGTVHVIDTTGVCLYVWAGHDNVHGGITAVPKTQLPQGVGCQ